MSNSPFLNSIRTDMRQKGYALKTEKTYLHWIKRFILFHKNVILRPWAVKRSGCFYPA